MNYTLRNYQRAAIDALFEFLCEKIGHPLIVLPTGSGKSVVMAAFASEVLAQYPDQKILVLQHRQELIQQNFEKMVALCDERVSIGMYSAGLGIKQTHNSITVASIQSIFRQAHKLRAQDLIIIDEAHLLPPENMGMYRTLIQELTARNPYLRIIGLTATPFRMTTGCLTDDDGLFTDIAYDADVKQLIADGFLSPVVSKRGVAVPELSELKVRKGDFLKKELENLYTDEVTEAALAEVFRYAGDRKSILIFCSGVLHSENVALLLRAAGEKAESVTGNTEKLFREQYLQDFKRGKLRFLCNCDVLTTGFDAPNVDCIVMYRPTKSAGLYCQMIGRGMRIAEGKENCLLLDFAGNVEEHGPIDLIKVVKKATRDSSGKFKIKNEVEKSEAKMCDRCRAMLQKSAPKCTVCGFIFPPEIKHGAHASDESPISSGEPAEPELLPVTRTEYVRHRKEGKPDSLKIIFHCGFRTTVNEFLCLEHGGRAAALAAERWKKQSVYQEIPKTVQEALFQIASGALRDVQMIRVIKKEKFYRVLNWNWRKNPDKFTNEKMVPYLAAELAPPPEQLPTYEDSEFLSSDVFCDDDIPF